MYEFTLPDNIYTGSDVTVKATFKALAQLRDPYTVAQVRGIGLDQVFNG